MMSMIKLVKTEMSERGFVCLRNAGSANQDAVTLVFTDTPSSRINQQVCVVCWSGLEELQNSGDLGALVQARCQEAINSYRSARRAEGAVA